MKSDYFDPKKSVKIIGIFVILITQPLLSRCADIKTEKCRFIRCSTQSIQYWRNFQLRRVSIFYTP
jgi:hypothetical protein